MTVGSVRLEGNQDIDCGTVEKCFTMPGLPAAVADAEDLANMLQANTISLDLHDPMMADEHVMIDDDLLVMETIGIDWEQSILR